jgi:monoamine oxidase
MREEKVNLAHSPLARNLQMAYAVVHALMEKDCKSGQAINLNNILPKRANSSQYLKTPCQMRSGNSPRIVVVGAGLAGLTCAYRLKQYGIKAMVYEASYRVGGRCMTGRGIFNENQLFERGGELIDSGHKEIRDLAKELGLKLDDLKMAELSGTEPFYFFNSRPYTFREAIDDFLRIYPKLQQDLKSIGETTLYDCFTKRGFELDHMSIVDYINETVPGGVNSRFGRLLLVAYTIEYGADPHEQSSLNLLYLISSDQKKTFQLFGQSDERFHIRGGNDQLADILANQLCGQVHFECELVKIEQTYQNTVKLVFRHKEKERIVFADKVILAIPFRILREMDYKNAGFRPLKQMAINELGMGANTKFHVQFMTRFWNEMGNNGETFADIGYQNTFEGTRAQQGESGILVGYSGGKTAELYFAENKAQLQELTEHFLDKLEFVLPGSLKNYNGKSTIDHWNSSQWVKGSYSYLKVGQYTKFSGIEGEREGNVFFAGEHTSIEYKGYLNGAVETGERAAREVLRDVSNKKHKR